MNLHGVLNYGKMLQKGSLVQIYLFQLFLVQSLANLELRQLPLAHFVEDLCMLLVLIVALAKLIKPVTVLSDQVINSRGYLLLK